MKNIILIISLIFTYSCEPVSLGGLYWFMSGDVEEVPETREWEAK